MGILEFLKPPRLAEPVLGTLVRRGGYWRGEIKLDAAGPVPLVLAGPRSAPDAASVTLARELPLRLQGEASDAPGSDNRLHFCFDIDRTYLPQICRSLEVLLAAFPVVGTTDA